MSKAGKIILITAGVMLLSGVLLTMLGVFLGGKMSWSLEFNDAWEPVQVETIKGGQDLEEFDALDIDVSSVDLNIMRGDSYRIEYKTAKGYEPEIKEDDGKLTVKQPDTGKAVFGFGFERGMNTYNITVPENSNTIKLHIVASSGDIMLDRIKADGEVKASSGDIMLNDVEGETLEANTSSGEIKCDKVKMKKAGFSANSGDIEMLRVYSEEVSCRTSSGDIEINNAQIDNLDCNATSGDVSVELDGEPDEYAYDLSASSGDINVNGEEREDSYIKENNCNKKVSVKTSSGDIEISIG